LNEARGRFASLQALQQAALGQSDGGIQWLTGQGLAEKPRLGQQIKVKPGWETAVETVLGEYLQAVCVDDVDAVTIVLDSIADANLTFLSTMQNDRVPHSNDDCNHSSAVLHQQSSAGWHEYFHQRRLDLLAAFQSATPAQ
jgi:chromosome segregation ATPase